MLKACLKKLLLKEKSSSESYIRFLNQQGCRISDKAWFVAPSKVTIDITRPYLIEIGDWVTITEGVTILTHGFDWSVLKRKYGYICGSSGRVVIRDNVFIGAGTVILKGVTVGENSIIGAGSVVTRDIPENSVAAGNPCRVIMSLEDYLKKRMSAQTDEAVELVRSYWSRFNRAPSEADLSEFCMLFCTRDDLMNGGLHSNKVGYACEGVADVATYDPPFPSFDAFIQFALNEVADVQKKC